MKRLSFCFLSVLMVFSVLPLRAQLQVDSVNVLHYDLTLDIGYSQERTLGGTAVLTMVLDQPSDTLRLQLKPATISMVAVDNNPVTGYVQVGESLNIPFASVAVGDTVVVTVSYAMPGYVERYGWGGFHFDNNIYYNLGVAFEEYPHNFGRAMFPCRDNFHDKATYRLTVTSKPEWTSLCSGVCDTAFLNADSSQTSVWSINHPVATYLVSVASAPWRVISHTIQGEYDTYPLTLGYSADSLGVEHAYELLNSVVPFYERCFGPYRWGRIGYVSTPQGSMEHVNNIGLVRVCMNNMESACQSTIAHELSHAWFGNLITCSKSGEMWFNEGGASFCEEVAAEAVGGREAALEHYQETLEEVLRNAHNDDGAYVPLYDVPETITYGTTVYRKGAIVWHSLRGLLGDSLFYASLRQLFSDYAFDTIGSQRLCTLLSSYSGVDLRDFFDFHVYQAGFVDYDIELLESQSLGTQWETALTLRQQTEGSQAEVCRGAVPVTFFSADMQREKRWFDMSSERATFSVTLPFEPKFAIIDYDHELSDAVVDDEFSPHLPATTTLPLAHCKLQVVSTPSRFFFHVAHHFAPAFSEPTQGIVRMAHRYWVVNGTFADDAVLKGYFYFQRKGNGGEYPNLDAPFYTTSATLDSIVVLYRPTFTEPWQVVSHTHEGGRASGYFVVDNLRKGEYTLAVVDTALVSIANQPVPPSALTLMPNPAKDGFRVAFDSGKQPVTLYVYDINGHEVYHKEDVQNGDFIAVSLVPGTYIVKIQNNCLSLQTQIIML